MPRKGITGHDDWVVTEALATALVALEQLPSKHQPACAYGGCPASCSTREMQMPEPSRCIWRRPSAGCFPIAIR